MPSLAGTIRGLVEAERYAVSIHAANKLDERGIMEWQAVAGMDGARVLTERSTATPNPVVEFEVELPDGTAFKAVWALVEGINAAKLVTVHFFDDED